MNTFQKRMEILVAQAEKIYTKPGRVVRRGKCKKALAEDIGGKCVNTHIYSWLSGVIPNEFYLDQIIRVEAEYKKKLEEL